MEEEGKEREGKRELSMFACVLAVLQDTCTYIHASLLELSYYTYMSYMYVYTCTCTTPFS